MESRRAISWLCQPACRLKPVSGLATPTDWLLHYSSSRENHADSLPYVTTLLKGFGLFWVPCAVTKKRRGRCHQVTKCLFTGKVCSSTSATILRSCRAAHYIANWVHPLLQQLPGRCKYVHLASFIDAEIDTISRHFPPLSLYPYEYVQAVFFRPHNTYTTTTVCTAVHVLRIVYQLPRYRKARCRRQTLPVHVVRTALSTGTLVDISRCSVGTLSSYTLYISQCIIRRTLPPRVQLLLVTYCYVLLLNTGPPQQSTINTIHTSAALSHSIMCSVQGLACGG